jgi:hypothetical protein
MMQDEQPGLKSMVLDMLDPHSLPSGWTPAYDEATERRYYVHAASDKTVWMHPNIQYYKGIVFMESGGMAQMMENIESDPPTSSDIQQMADYLDIQEDDDQLVKEVALFECCAPLPPSYAEIETSCGDVLFRCALHSGVHGKHSAVAIQGSRVQESGSRTLGLSAMVAQAMNIKSRLCKVSCALCVMFDCCAGMQPQVCQRRSTLWTLTSENSSAGVVWWLQRTPKHLPYPPKLMQRLSLQHISAVQTCTTLWLLPSLASQMKRAAPGNSMTTQSSHLLDRACLRATRLSRSARVQHHALASPAVVELHRSQRSCRSHLCPLHQG